MVQKRAIFWLAAGALFLTAFGRPPAPRTNADSKVLFRFLTTVQADGSAEFEYRIQYDKEAVAEFLKDGDREEGDLCAESTSQIAEYIGSFSQEKHDEQIWCSYSKAMDDLDELGDYLEDHFRVDVNQLEIEDKTFLLELKWPEFPCERDNPSEFSCEWVVEAPGKIKEHNATRADGNTLIWDMSVSGTPLTFTAKSAVGAGTDYTLAIVVVLLSCCCCTTALLIAGGAAALFILRRRKSAAEPSAPAAEPPSGPPPSPATTIQL